MSNQHAKHKHTPEKGEIHTYLAHFIKIITAPIHICMHTQLTSNLSLSLSRFLFFSLSASRIAIVCRHQNFPFNFQNLIDFLMIYNCQFLQKLSVVLSIQQNFSLICRCHFLGGNEQRFMANAHFFYAVLTFLYHLYKQITNDMFS